ncbi:MAG: SCO family protein [Flavobacteriaceae bacterium]|nr:MAG: SCO family protein [Flavobacteriaceae bacterium]
MDKKYAYVGVAFIILIFGMYTVRNLSANFKDIPLVQIKETPIPSFQFTNQDGVLMSSDYYKGKVYVVEFFFTTCTTICPKMNVNMVKIQNEFYSRIDFGIASFSINPKHDSPEILKAYAKEKGANSKRWHFFTGDQDAIYDLATNGFTLYVGENDQVLDGFEHSGSFALIDKNGFIRSRKDNFGNPIGFYDGLTEAGIKMIIEDITILLKE